MWAASIGKVSVVYGTYQVHELKVLPSDAIDEHLLSTTQHEVVKAEFSTSKRDRELSRLTAQTMILDPSLNLLLSNRLRLRLLP